MAERPKRQSRVTGLLNFDPNDSDTKRRLKKAAASGTAQKVELVDTKGWHAATQNWAVREYFSDAPLGEILTRLVQAHGRRAIDAALKRLASDRIHDNDRWSVWLAVKERMAAGAAVNVDDACAKIAKLGGIPRWLPKETLAGRIDGTGYTTRDKLRAAYLRADKWVNDSRSPSRKQQAATLLSGRGFAGLSGKDFEKGQRAMLDALWTAAKERAKRVHKAPSS